MNKMLCLKRMSAISQQSFASPTKPLFAPIGVGDSNLLTTSTIKTNNIVVSTISNLFDYTGLSTTTFQPIFFDQLAPFASLNKMEIKLRQRATNAGAIQSMRMGVDYQGVGGYLRSEWDGYLPMPLVIGCQDLKIQDETGLCMFVNNQITQVPQLSTINVQTANINGLPYTTPTYLSTSSNYSNSFTFNGGQNVTLFSYNFGSIIPSGTYEYSVPIMFNTSNSPGQSALILEVYGGGVNVDSNTSIVFDQKTNDFVYFTLRGQVVIGGASPAITVAGTCADTFDVTVQSVSGAQTAVLKRIA